MANEPLVWTQLITMDAVRNTIGDPNGAATERWTDAEIASYCDRAQLVVILDTGTILRTVWDFTLTDGAAEYVMAENFVEAHKVKWWKANDESDQRELTYLTFTQFMEAYPKDPIVAGDPSHYTFWNKLKTDATTTMQPPILMIRPVKATITESDRVRVWGVKTPDVFASGTSYGDTLEIRGQHVEALISYAASLAFWDDDEAGKAQAMEGRYQRMVEKIKHDEARRDRSRRPMIRARSSRLYPYRDRARPLPQHFNRGWGL